MSAVDAIDTTEFTELEPSGEVFNAKLSVLQENTEHHIEEEEGSYFQKCAASGPRRSAKK